MAMRASQSSVCPLLIGWVLVYVPWATNCASPRVESGLKWAELLGLGGTSAIAPVVFMLWTFWGVVLELPSSFRTHIGCPSFVEFFSEYTPPLLKSYNIKKNNLMPLFG